MKGLGLEVPYWFISAIPGLYAFNLRLLLIATCVRFP